MAERRMFTQKIIDSDAFLDMPLSTQALYFHLNMRADDDGFVNNPKRIQRTIGASDDDLKLLIAKRFVIGFECGVIVIKHWRMHNTLRKDRYNPTQYQDELAMLEVKDNNAYTEKIIEIPAVPQLPEPKIESVATTWQPNGNQLATQYSIGKDSIGKVSIDNIPVDSDESKPVEPPKPKNGKTKAEQEYEDLVMKVCELLGKHDYSLFTTGTGELQKAILAFVQFRKDIKKPMTDRAIDLLIGKLKRMSSDIGVQVEIINQSIINGWQGIFPLKENEAKPQRYGSRKEKLPGWFKEYEAGEAEQAAIRKLMGLPPEDHSESEEAKQLRQELEASFGRKAT